MENYINEQNLPKHFMWIRVLVMLCATAIVIVSIVMALDKDNTDHQFSVTASGKVTAIPDIANITLGVYTEAQPTAAEAVKKNTIKMNKIILALEGIDIGKKNITTSNYSLNPVYDWTDKKGRTLKGYEVRQNVTIKIRDLENIGKAIQVTSEEGANQVGGVNFTIDDPDELKKEAMAIAINKAKAKANELAKIAGLKKGKLINVYESQTHYPDARVNKVYALDEASGLKGTIPKPIIEAGEQELAVEVTLVYEVK